MTAFVFAELKLTDKVIYKQEYVPLALRAVAAFRGRFVSTGRRASIRIGAATPETRTVLIAFPDFKTANEFYDSELYRNASLVRERCAVTATYAILDADGEVAAGSVWPGSVPPPA